MSRLHPHGGMRATPAPPASRRSHCRSLRRPRAPVCDQSILLRREAGRPLRRRSSPLDYVSSPPRFLSAHAWRARALAALVAPLLRDPRRLALTPGGKSSARSDGIQIGCGPLQNHPTRTIFRAEVRPSSSRRAAQAHQRAAQVPHSAVVREMPAFLVELRAFALRGLGGPRPAPRWGKRKTEFVVATRVKIGPLLVLHFDAFASRHCVRGVVCAVLQGC